MTETAAVAILEDAKQFTTRLCGLGCGLALDDFGAGFGSFYYIKTFLFDYLKIDGAFIRGLGANATDRLVVQALVNIAKGLEKRPSLSLLATRRRWTWSASSASTMRKATMSASRGPLQRCAIEHDELTVVSAGIKPERQAAVRS